MQNTIDVEVAKNSESAKNKRIAKNAAMLYVRMFLVMGVTLFTSREVLRLLGVDDFGIYNVVGGIIVLFTFLNSAMTASTQRFLNFELGRGRLDNVSRCFSASVTIHIWIAIVTLLIGEIVGIWFLNEYIQIPEGREYAANWALHFSLLGAAVNIIRTPYNAALIAYEKMSFYAYVSIVEVFLKLAVVYLLLISDFDKLILYSALMFVVICVVTGCYYIYSRQKFKECRYKLFYDKSLYKSLMSFSGWSLFGSLANVGSYQGTNIILNIFHGVGANAAIGIANQVQTAVSSFVANFQTAFNPQLVKSYAAGENSYFIKLILRTSKYSFYLLFVISLPIYIYCDKFLGIWLSYVPPYAVDFSRLIILVSLLDAIQGPLWISVQATGRIKIYQICVSLLTLMNIPFSYIAMKYGYPPNAVLVIKIVVSCILLLYRIGYLRKTMGLSMSLFAKEVLVPSIIISVVSYVSISLLSMFGNGMVYLLVVSAISVLLNSVMIMWIGLTTDERRFLMRAIRNRFSRGI